MLFRKKLPRSCSYCKFSTVFDENHFLCTKKGLVECDGACRKFSYDPCKRIPPKQKAPDFLKYDPENFKL